jgi:cell pole-organizing protein PopZ
MSQAAKAQEPSMEEILASIRRIIADDDSKPVAKPEAKAPEPKPAPKPAPAPPPPAAAMKQDDIDAMLAGLDAPAEPEPPPPPPPPPEPEPEPEVLELTEAMQAPASPGFRKIDAQQDVVFEEAPDFEPPRPAPRAPEPRMAASTPDPSIMSHATAAAVDSAFNALAHTVLVQNAKTLEDLVKEMLRPMLQHWLDNNLPTLVERLVRQEIERVARGRG